MPKRPWVSGPSPRYYKWERERSAVAIKIEYLAETEKIGPQYVLRPENALEMRFLTIWRDIGLHPDIMFRVVGFEGIEKEVAGQPANPVAGLKLQAQRKDGKAPRAAELRKQSLDKLLDPSQPTPRKQSRRSNVVGQQSSSRGMRVTPTGKRTSIVEER